MSERERYCHLRNFIKSVGSQARSAYELSNLLLETTEAGPAYLNAKIVYDLLQTAANNSLKAYRMCHAAGRVLHSLFGTHLIQTPKRPRSAKKKDGY